MSTSIRAFTDLVVWQKAVALAVQVYEVTTKLPQEEKFGLSRQSRSAVVSIPANIAEGYGRRSSGDYHRFLNIAMGSLRELQTYVVLLKELKLHADTATLFNSCEEVARMLYKLERAIAAKM